ncbi:MAG TPA: 2-hydroxymuconate tautomerase [Acidimicrobiia bacterium]|nr:2-hydroxymuconate tautomerase [Acidimicrobiia bacterium]
MPLVYINLMEGRPPEKIEKMITAVSQAISTSLGAPIESVRIMVYEMQPHQYGVGGKPWREVLEERKKDG